MKKGEEEEEDMDSDFDVISLSDPELESSADESSEDDETDERVEKIDTEERHSSNNNNNNNNNNNSNNDTSEHFLPNTPITIHITEANYTPKSHMLHPYLYTIEIQHGSYTWTVKRRFDKIHELHRSLQVARATEAVRYINLNTKKVPKIPRRPEATIRQEKKGARMERLEKFLQNVMNIDVYRNNKHTLQFLEISSLSFHKNLGGKEKESEIWKRVGGYNFAIGALGVGRIDPTWHKRWLVLKKNFLAYMDQDRSEVRGVMLFDSMFTVECGIQKTGIEQGLLISNSTRNLTVQCLSTRDADEWMSRVVQLMGKDEYSKKGKRFSSFAPERSNAAVKWYTDGKDYFSDVADVIMAAKEEIFITDWWLSPEIHLKRSQSTISNNRLDQLLKLKADEGVKVYVLLYKEVELSLGINSAYSKSTLVALNSDNIKVLRHPDHVGGNMTLYWAHHEKIVCVDQNICFLGGLDLCFGRWDDHNHPLTDFGSAQPSFMHKTNSMIARYAEESDHTHMKNEENSSHLHAHGGGLNPLSPAASKVFIGKDYTNPYIADVPEVEKPFDDYLIRESQPRMPWHDIASVVLGDAARDAARHFIQRWNFTKNEKAKEREDYPFLLPKQTDPSEGKDYTRLIKNLGKCNVQILRSASAWSAGNTETEDSILQAYLHHIENSKHYIYIENQFFISSLGDDKVENGIGDALVKRITKAHDNNETFRVYVVMPLLPSFPGEIGTPEAAATCFVEYWNLKSSRYIVKHLSDHGIPDPSDYIFFSGLRTFADLQITQFTEIVYVHSKLMIVDDSAVIMGSANINDRSMLGTRDSEIAICIEDVERIPCKMNQVDVEVGPFAHSLRVHLFKEHLGLLADDFEGVRDKAILVSSPSSGPDAIEDVTPRAGFLEGDVKIDDRNTTPTTNDDMSDIVRQGASEPRKEDETVGEKHAISETQADASHTTADAIKIGTAVPDSDMNCSEASQINDEQQETDNSLTVDVTEIEIPTLTENSPDSPQETSETSDIPEIPEVPEIPEIPDIPKTQEIPDADTETSSETEKPSRPPPIEIIVEDKMVEEELEEYEALSPIDISKPSPHASFKRRTIREETTDQLISLEDPVCSEFYRNAWVDRAKKNAEIYEEVFRCLPTNAVTSFEGLPEYKSKPRLVVKDPMGARSMLESVQGFLVEKPLEFLSKQNLWPETGSKESLVPVTVFT